MKAWTEEQTNRELEKKAGRQDQSRNFEQHQQDLSKQKSIATMRPATCRDACGALCAHRLH